MIVLKFCINKVPDKDKKKLPGKETLNSYFNSLPAESRWLL